VTLLYVDTSNHDDDEAPIGWAAAARATAPVMIHKASEGDPGGYHYTDPYFTTAVTGARAAGYQLVGGYHCISHGDQAAINRQVDWLLKRADSVGGYAAGWWMLDIEPFQELVDRGVWPRFDDIRRFEDRFDALTGGWPLAHYIPRWFWDLRPGLPSLGRPDLTQLRGPLIASNYPVRGRYAAGELYTRAGGDSGAGWASYGGRAPDIWQYASSAAVPGLVGGCDINAFRGDLAQFAALVTKGATLMADLTWPKSDPVGERTAGTLLDDQWCQEQLGHSGFDAARSYRSALLDEVRDLVRTLVERPTATVVLSDVDRAALANDVAAALADRIGAQVDALAASVDALLQRLGAAGRALDG
jgi:hypothetical protein